MLFRSLSVIAGVGVVLLAVTIIGSSIFSPAFFGMAQPLLQVVNAVYNAVVSILASVLLFIFTPLFLLANWWFSRHAVIIPQVRQNGVCNSNTSASGTPTSHPVPRPSACNPHPLSASDAAGYTAFLTVLTRVLLPALILLALILLIRWAWRRRKKIHLALNRKSGDVHESVWSWRLFWGQLRSVLWALFGRFFPKHASDGNAQQEEELSASPAARTIREIYRALLKKAASRGQIRKRDETPHEFQSRLDQYEPQNEPQLGLLTEAYALTRYGGGVPSEPELLTIRQFWNELDQKWEVAPHQ